VKQVNFNVGPNELSGILTLPAGGGPNPAIVLISGSIDPSTGARPGAASGYFREHARMLAQDGWAVLCYDPPGVGQSTGEVGFGRERPVRMQDKGTTRFVHAAHMIQNAPPSVDADYGFKILKTLARGLTQWSIVIDVNQGRVHFRTSVGKKIKYLEAVPLYCLHYDKHRHMHPRDLECTPFRNPCGVGAPPGPLYDGRRKRPTHAN
jgi:hypothetical protein